jgi:hypothetical protein
MAASIISLLAVFCFADGNAVAAATVMVDVDAAVNSSAQLTLTPLTINFPDADPDVTPRINAIENPVRVTVQAQTGKKKTVTLTVLAQGDLASGPDSIPISNVMWTATGDGFAPGTMSKSAAVTAGTWVGPGIRRGAFSYTLANSWNYHRGSYRATVIYTLSAP